MRLQDQVVRATQRAMDDVVRAALATPMDRLEYSPGGAARSVLGQMRELATSADWVRAVVEARAWPEAFVHGVDPGALDLAACLDALREGTSRLCRVVAEFPDAELDHEVRLPFGGGMMATMADILDLHRWNMVYHLGQISQIQLILGDAEMH